MRCRVIEPHRARGRTTDDVVATTEGERATRARAAHDGRSASPTEPDGIRERWRGAATTTTPRSRGGAPSGTSSASGRPSTSKSTSSGEASSSSGWTQDGVREELVRRRSPKVDSGGASTSRSSRASDESGSAVDEAEAQLHVTGLLSCPDDSRTRTRCRPVIHRGVVVGAEAVAVRRVIHRFRPEVGNRPFCSSFERARSSARGQDDPQPADRQGVRCRHRRQCAMSRERSASSSPLGHRSHEQHARGAPTRAGRGAGLRRAVPARWSADPARHRSAVNSVKAVVAGFGPLQQYFDDPRSRRSGSTSRRKVFVARGGVAELTRPSSRPTASATSSSGC